MLMFKGMRRFVFAVAAATALFVIPMSAFSQSIQIGPGGVRIDEGRGRGGQCEELRLACENKDRLGEQGKEIVADTGKPAKGQSDAMCAVSCAQLASTRIGWANKAKGIVVDTARLVEVESNSHCRRAEAAN